MSSSNKPKFNGFCFGVNVEKIAPAAFEPNVHLFDPRDRIVGQEDSLTARMEKVKLFPILLHCSFVYHFKSKTVSAANFTLFEQILKRNNATVVEKGSFPTVKIAYKEPSSKSVTHFMVDIREDLRWYHQEDSDAYESLVTGPSFMQSLIKSSKKKATTGASAELEYDEDLDVWNGLQCKAPANDVLFPPPKEKDQSSLAFTYKQYVDMSWNIRSNPYCLYPSQWQPHCNKLLQDSSFFEPELFAYAKSSTIVIAIAMSGTL